MFLICCVFITRSVIASESQNLGDLNESERAAYLDQLKREDEAALLHLSGITLAHLGLARKAALTPDLGHIKNLSGSSHEPRDEYQHTPAYDYACFRGEFSAIPRASLIAERRYGKINARICIPHDGGVKEIPVHDGYFGLMAQEVAKKNQTASQK